MTIRNDITGIALDLGGTKIAAARIQDGRVMKRLVHPTSPNDPPALHVTRMLEMAQKLGLAKADRIGMAVTGRIDAQGLWHAVNAGTLTDVKDANLIRLASHAFDRPVPIVNDALAAAIAEYKIGAGQGSSAMAYLTVSTGVGGGLIIDGKPLASPNGLAGHVGFTTSRQSQGQCGSGRTGTVESVAGGRAIAAIAAAQGHDITTAKQVFEHAAAGVEWADEIIDTAALAIAELLGNLTATLGTDRVVLGGSIGLADGFADRVGRHLLKEPALFRTDLRIAQLGQDSVLLGALMQPSLVSRR